MMICSQMNWVKWTIIIILIKWLNSSTGPIVETLTPITTQSQSGSGSYGNEVVLPIPLNSRIVSSPLDATPAHKEVDIL